jgi:phosphatidate cytidylyltransferase
MSNNNHETQQTPEPVRDGDPVKKSRIGSDLLPRVLSGIVMASVALVLTFAGTVPFAFLVLAIALVVSWEWGRIVRSTEVDIVLAAHLGGVAVGIILAAMGLPALGILALAIATILVGLLAFGRTPILSAVGVACSGLPGVALLWLRSDGVLGLWAVLYILLTVVLTDVGAYFSGRLVGGPKIWPAISPNKTWAGLIGAMAAATTAGWIFGTFSPVPAAADKLALCGALIAIVAQMGDFAESALKRHFGTKDASSLIPGHGGFMDRVDGLTTVAIAAAIYAVIKSPLSPAHAILSW